MKRDILAALLGAAGHGRRAKVEELEILHTSSTDPDTIAIEARHGEKPVFEFVVDCHGTKTLWIGGMEFDRDELLALLSRSAQELDAWDAKLREPGQVWEKEEKRRP